MDTITSPIAIVSGGLNLYGRTIEDIRALIMLAREFPDLFTESAPAPRVSPSIAGRGPIEAQFLAASGMQRLKVPSDYHGTREEYAAQRLADLGAPVAEEETTPDDEGDAF